MTAERGQLPFNPEDYSLGEILKPRRCALLVIDVQNDFMHPAGFFAGQGRDIASMQAVVPFIQRLIDKAHNAGVPVIFTKIYEDLKYRSEPGRRRYITWEEEMTGVNCLENTFGSEFYQLSPSSEDIVLEKPDWSTFTGKDSEGKDLEIILKERGITTLVITGVKTEICVGTTVREGHTRGYFVVVPREAIGSDDRLQHEANLANFDPIYGDVVDAEVVLKNWSTPQI